MGKFESGGQAYESELWGDIDDVKSQFKREYSAALIRCSGPAEVKRLCKLIEGDKQFKLSAKPTLDYYSEQNIGGQMIKSFGVVLAVIVFQWSTAPEQWIVLGLWGVTGVLCGLGSRASQEPIH